jgi:parallel beta-helix repeat protein
MLSLGSMGWSDTIYVNPDGSEDFTTIQTAIDAGTTGNGDIIIVRIGRYNENVMIYGKSITLQSEQPTNLACVQDTVIDGGGVDSVIDCDGSAASDTVISGFTLENGGGGYGAGISLDSSSPTISHCIIADNTASYNGGGIFCGSSSPTISHCTFMTNTARNGGAVYAQYSSTATFTDCTFKNNSTHSLGGAAYHNKVSPGVVRYIDCIFENNTTNYAGGAAYNDNSNVAYVNSQFKANSTYCTDPEGGGVGGALYNVDSSVTIANCIFLSNEANSDLNGPCKGGAIYNNASSLTITNCTFRYNKAYYKSYGNYGGAIYNDSDSGPVINNCIFRQNNTESEAEIYNNSSSVKPTISYSNIYGSDGSGTSWDSSLGIDGGGNIDALPYFKSGDDLQLLSHSPCIDTGSNLLASLDFADVDGDGITTEFTPVDLANSPRFIDHTGTTDTGIGSYPGFGIIDMGAYEYQETILVADLNNDGSVNMIDLLCFTGQWLSPTCQGCYSADINNDGEVDFQDYAKMTANW